MIGVVKLWCLSKRYFQTEEGRSDKKVEGRIRKAEVGTVEVELKSSPRRIRPLAEKKEARRKN
jgi:hypothetical protein